ncbi:barstar family protein [Bradyrhizobium liaoningense]|uniref:barstar family protein n=1 Tax=Bradyrhizobium liaoningense TaxID=43992 RepID=UPI001BAE28D7|nr:barstar family protein [Bradyrhizobium liaoningense]MBR0705334.1 barstar family protein [Bradyrhizobium liaoningense]
MPVGFAFGDDGASHDAAVHANVPQSITTKRALLTAIATQLSFPDYFGGNWDALEECIRDLSWLPSGRVLVTHVDVPLVEDVRSAMVYVAILKGAASKLSTSEHHPLSIVFPAQYRDQVLWLLRSGERS